MSQLVTIAGMDKKKPIAGEISPSKLAAKIKETGLSKAFVAAEAGIAAPNLSRILSGDVTNARVSLVAALARVLECSIEDLLE